LWSHLASPLVLCGQRKWKQRQICGAGGFGRMASLMSFDAMCNIAHEERVV
jgi:hypothetical protein